MCRWEKYDYYELADLLSDYHKDVHGYRLRLHGEPRAVILAELDALDKHMEQMRSTPEGREQLAAEGWQV